MPRFGAAFFHRLKIKFSLPLPPSCDLITLPNAFIYEEFNSGEQHMAENKVYAGEATEDGFTSAIEKRTSQIPSSAYLGCALASMGPRWYSR